MKIGIVGSRTITDYNAIKQVLDTIVQDGDEIISGGADGVDSLAERYAVDMGYSYTIYKPDWNKYGKSAGLIRNGLIVEDSDYIIAFWDGKSKGTMDTIRKAENSNKQVMKFIITN